MTRTAELPGCDDRDSTAPWATATAATARHRSAPGGARSSSRTRGAPWPGCDATVREGPGRTDASSDDGPAAAKRPRTRTRGASGARGAGASLTRTTGGRAGRRGARLPKGDGREHRLHGSERDAVLRDPKSSASRPFTATPGCASVTEAGPRARRRTAGDGSSFGGRARMCPRARGGPRARAFDRSALARGDGGPRRRERRLRAGGALLLMNQAFYVERARR